MTEGYHFHPLLIQTCCRRPSAAHASALCWRRGWLSSLAIGSTSRQLVDVVAVLWTTSRDNEMSLRRFPVGRVFPAEPQKEQMQSVPCWKQVAKEETQDDGMRLIPLTKSLTTRRGA